MAESDFNPREAALRYAGDVSRVVAAAPDVEGEAVASAVNAIVCGLVYVGDQLARQSAVAVALASPDADVAELRAILDENLGGRHG